MTGAKLENAVFGGGCFWCTEAVFRMLEGVEAVKPGYAAGKTDHPTYEDVCSGHTGHAEVVRVEFDPGRCSFEDLLTVFFSTHDPTTKDRQGNDVGTQYRSIILYATPDQKKAATEFIQALNDSDPGGRPVVTQVEPLGKFYEAERYHEDYFARNPGQPYCQFIIEPKVRKVREKFKELLKAQGA